MSGGVEIVSSFTGAAIQAAIDKVIADTNFGGGVVLLPPGNYIVSSPINMKAKITLQGSGKQSTALTAAGDITVLKINGAASANAPGSFSVNHIASVCIKDLAIDGGDNPAWSTQPMVTMYYAHTAEITSVQFRNKWGIGVLIGAETWDCTWSECRWDSCGGVNQSKPSMLIQSADGATFPAFGSSTDATNDQRFFHCTWESFRDGALWTASPTGANQIGNLSFFGCKADQNQTALGRWWVFDNVAGVFFDNLDQASTAGGASYLGTPYDIFTFSRVFTAKLEGIAHYHNSSHNSTLFNFDGTTGQNAYIDFDGVFVNQIGSGAGAFGTSVVKFTSTNAFFNGLETIRYISSSPTAIKPIFSGTVPSQKPIAIRTKSGAFSDAADFGTQAPGIPTGMAAVAGVDFTNGRLYVRYADGTYHYATLT